MIELKPATRKEMGYKKTKYQTIIDEFVDSGMAGAKIEVESVKRAHNVASGLSMHLKRSNREHIEVHSSGNVVYLFNTILEEKNNV